MTVRTRFAPSPTGALHVGSVRTALYNWLYARHFEGEFILRIEDTDKNRSKQSYVDNILSSLEWLCLNSDVEPIYQSQHIDRYHEVAQRLLNSGHAYYCNCSPERLQILRTEQQDRKEKPRYDGRCRDASRSADGAVVRLRTPQEGLIHFNDEVYGRIEVANKELDDLILLRADKMPTYHFSVVIDDWDMKISHIIRGEDHINNTLRQLHILHALQAPEPIYAHLPMLLGDDGKRLSKRHGALSVLHYREAGFLPEALLNYLVRLGWSQGDQEIFSQKALIDAFDLPAIHKAPATFDTQKLQWYNQYYLKAMPLERLTEHLKAYMPDSVNTSKPVLQDVAQLYQTRCKTLSEMADQIQFFYHDKIEYSTDNLQKYIVTVQEPLAGCRHALLELQDWQGPSIIPLVKQTVKAFGLKFPQLAQAIRVAVTGDITSPGIGDTLSLLGKERTLARIDDVLKHASNMS